ncbi:MAG: hypothetical protein IT354_20370 [Gemmatimonadaceae bacterium]|nr:hypothetical protein [Gemmatimonadaceae bacterium]
MNTKTVRPFVLSMVSTGAFAATIAVALLASAPVSSRHAVFAQSSRTAQPSIPRDYMPPANMCRVWIDGVPAAQQPAPTDCPTAIQKKPANARVIYGEEKGKSKGVEKVPVKGLNKAVPDKRPPLIPPDIQPTDPQYAKAERERKRMTDDQLFGEQQPAPGSASSYSGAGASPQGPMGSYSGYVAPGGVVVGGGALQDPRYFNNNPNVRPPGTGSSACLDRDGDGWCDDSRFGPPVCLDKDQDGRCDDLPGFASQAYPQVLPPMRAALDVIQGRTSAEVMTWLGTNEFIVRVPDQGRGGVPWRALFLDTNNELLQVWTDTNRDGRADRVEIFKNGQRVKLIQR